MVSVFLALLLALVVTASAVPVVRVLALRVGAIDSPTVRRVHSRRIPRLGGVALVAGFFLPLAILFALHTSLAGIFFSHRRLLGGFVAGSIIVTALGVVDDLTGVSARRKLIVQLFAAGVAYAAGFRISILMLPIVGQFSLGWFGPVFTALWIVGIINALNLIDGLDGLAGGVAFFACVTNFVVGLLSQDLQVCLLSAALAGALMGFLFHNFNPATIFMGDSGSMFLGFALATMSIFTTSMKGTTAVAILVPIVALGLPIVDTMFAIVRRVFERRSIFSADRGHIHHRLLDLGLTHRRAVLFLYGTCVVLTCGAIAIYVRRSWPIGLAMLAVAVALVGSFRIVEAVNAALAAHVQRSRLRDPCVERLRRHLPELLGELAGGLGAEHIPAKLSSFAERSGLLAVELRPDAPGGIVAAWRWEAPATTGRIIHDTVSVKFPLADRGGRTFTLKFHWDSERGDVNPQAEILLQMAADGVEGVLSARSAAADEGRSTVPERASIG